MGCKYCLKSYVNILIHLKKKTNCMKNYVKNNEYDTLEKDIICNICERKFTGKHNLLEHLKKEHNTVEKNCKKKSKLRRKRKHNSNTEKSSSDADSSKSPSKWFVIEKETFTCKMCQNSYHNIKKL